MTETHNYHAYLLRVWRENDHEPWRVTLENPHTGERLAFAGVERLLAYFQQQWPLGDSIAPHPAVPVGSSLSEPP